MTTFSPDGMPEDGAFRQHCLSVLIELANEAFREKRRADCECYVDQINALLDD